MTRLRYAVVLAIPVLVGAAVAPSSPTDLPAIGETARIRTHLAVVERELRAKDVSSLTVAQRAARARNLDVLHEYWMRGIFPQNTDFPGQRVPYFIDRYGTRCAMAYLIEQSGGGDLVTRVAATHNNARIPELRTDPDLGAWLWRNGITLEEAARIQPAYGCCPVGAFCIDVIPQPCPSTTSASASVGYKVATGVSVGVDVLAVALNSVRSGLPRAVSGGLGLATGMVGVVIGAANFDQSGTRRTLGFLNASAGVASAALGGYRITRKPGPQARFSLAPWLDGRGGAGLSAPGRVLKGGTPPPAPSAHFPGTGGC